MTSESEDADELVDYSMRCDGRHGSPAGHRSAQQLAGHVGTWRLIAEKELLLRGGGAGERVLIKICHKRMRARSPGRQYPGCEVVGVRVSDTPS